MSFKGQPFIPKPRNEELVPGERTEEKEKHKGGRKGKERFSCSSRARGTRRKEMLTWTKEEPGRYLEVNTEPSGSHWGPYSTVTRILPRGAFTLANQLVFTITHHLSTLPFPRTL